MYCMYRSSLWNVTRFGSIATLQSVHYTVLPVHQVEPILFVGLVIHAVLLLLILVKTLLTFVLPLQPAFTSRSLRIMGCKRTTIGYKTHICWRTILGGVSDGDSDCFLSWSVACSLRPFPDTCWPGALLTVSFHCHTFRLQRLAFVPRRGAGSALLCLL